MAQLATTYMGLTLPLPLVASSSPLTERMDDLGQLEAAGAGAVVLPSLFEEQLERESEDHGYEDADEMRGVLRQKRDRDLAALTRANYVRVLSSYS